LICEHTLQNKDKGKILLIAERREHIDILSLYLKEKMEVLVLTGDMGSSRKWFEKILIYRQQSFLPPSPLG